MVLLVNHKSVTIFCASKLTLIGLEMISSVIESFITGFPSAVVMDTTDTTGIDHAG